MGLPHLTSFCCCMGLEMGSKVVGFVHLLVAVILMIMSSVFAGSVHGNVGTVEDSDQLYSTWHKIAVTVSVVSALHALLAATLIYSAYKVTADSTRHKIAVTVSVVSALHALLAATLIYSAYKRSIRGLRVWLVTMCVLLAVSLLYLFVEICVRGFTDTGSDIFLSFLEGVLFFGVVAYSLLCVYSYYLMLKSSEDMEGPGKTYY